MLDMSGLAIKDIAEQTGIAAGTIRMWEQRYGFPSPERTASGLPTLHRAETSRRCVASRPTATAGSPSRRAIERAREACTETDRPSIYAAVALTRPRRAPAGPAQVDARRARRAIEHEAIARAAAPVLVGAFQHEASTARSSPATAGWPTAPTPRSSSPTSRRASKPPGGPVEIPIAAARPRSATSGRSSSTRPATRPACSPGSSRASPSPATRTTPTAASRRSGRSTRGDPPCRGGRRPARRAADPEYGARLEELLADRPMALEEPAPALTALTNRMRRLPRVRGARPRARPDLGAGGERAPAPRGRSTSPSASAIDSSTCEPCGPVANALPSSSRTRMHSSRSGWHMIRSPSTARPPAAARPTAAPRAPGGRTAGRSPSPTPGCPEGRRRACRPRGRTTWASPDAARRARSAPRRPARRARA